MKKIECIIRPEKLTELTAAVRQVGAAGMTVSEVKGFGRNATRPENYLFLPKTKVEIFATAEEAADIIAAIVRSCADDKYGSGKIVVTAIEDCVRVRTGERGEKAIR